MGFGLEVSFVHGLVVGIEYMDGSDEEGDYSMIAIHIPFLRFCFIW
jgi:hypothetical protein